MNTKLKLMLPVATLAIGALSMVGVYAFADTSTPAASTPAASTTAAVPLASQTVQAGDDKNKGTDVETADDSAQTTQQDPGNKDGETADDSSISGSTHGEKDSGDTTEKETGTSGVNEVEDGK